MNTRSTHSPLCIVHCALCILLAASTAMAMPPPNVDFCSVEAADTPVDTRTYMVSDVSKAVNLLGQVLSQAKVADAPRRVVAAISPATIVYSDPDTGAVIGTSRFIGATLFGFNRYRQYKVGDGVFDLVSGDASIIRVKKRPDGNHDVQPIAEERDDDDGVGLTFRKPGRRLWDTTPTSLFPEGGQPQPDNSGGKTDGGASLFPMPQPSGGQGGAMTAPTPTQPRQPMTPAQKQLILSDIDLQISQLEGQLDKLQHDLIRAEGRRDRAVITDTGWIGASANVGQITSQINNVQFRLNMLRQQRMMLMSQP